MREVAQVMLHNDGDLYYIKYCINKKENDNVTKIAPLGNSDHEIVRFVYQCESPKDQNKIRYNRN